MAMASSDIASHTFYYFGCSFLYQEILCPNWTPQANSLSVKMKYKWMTADDKKKWQALRKAVVVDLGHLLGAYIPFKRVNYEAGVPDPESVLSHFELKGIVQGKRVWIYEHTDYATFSSVSVKHINGCAGIERVDIEDGFCGCKAHHYLLAPYFYDNRGLIQKYQMYFETSTNEVEKKEIERRISDVKKYNADPDHCVEYQCHTCPGSSGFSFRENVWTERLYYGVKALLPHVECKFTAPHNDFDALQMLYTKQFGSTSNFIFRGAPDMILHHTVVVTGVRVHDDDEEDSSFDGSIELTRDPLAIDRTTTHLPIKLGELIAQVYFLMVAKSLRRIKKGNPVGTVSCHGLLLDKQTGGIQVTATTSCIPVTEVATGIKIQVKTYPSGLLEPERLCYYLNCLVSGSVPTSSGSQPQPPKSTSSDSQPHPSESILNTRKREIETSSSLLQKTKKHKKN